MKKQEVYSTVSAELEGRIVALQKSIKMAQESSKEDSKSTAGDKHETSRAMAHLEQEKSGMQLSQLLQLKKVLTGLNPAKINSKGELGSLIQTDKGIFYISISLGQVDVNGVKVMCISPVAPLGKMFLNKEKNIVVSFNGINYKIEAIS